MPVDATHYAFGPTVAVVVVCLFGVLLRWINSNGRRARIVPRATTSEYGLLQVVATVAGRPEGNALRALLSDAGIRSTVTVRPDGQADVLVFREDVDRARQILPPIR